MADRLCVVIVCKDPTDCDRSLAPLLALQDDLESRGARTFLAFPNTVSHLDWFTKLCLSGRGMETFQTGTDEALTASLKGLYERKKPTAVCTLGLPPLPVEKAAAGYLQTKTYLYVDRAENAAEKNLPRFLIKFFDFLIYQHYGKSMGFIAQSDLFRKAKPLHFSCIPLPIERDVPIAENAERADFRRLRGVPEGCTLVACSVGLSDGEGLITAAEAVNKLVSVLSLPVRMLIGTHAGESEKQIRDFLEKNGVGCDNLIFAGAARGMTLLSLSDVCLSSAMQESFPRRAVEMLSLGRRAVVSSIPGTEFLSKFATVTTFEAGNADDCARALLTSIRSGDAPNPTVASYVKQRFSEEEWVASIRRLLLSV